MEMSEGKAQALLGAALAPASLTPLHGPLPKPITKDVTWLARWLALSVLCAHLQAILRTTEPQNGLGWKGPSKIIYSNPLL